MQAEDVDAEMTSPPSDSQSDEDVRHLVDEYLAEHGDEILPLEPEDVRSMLPSEAMSSFALQVLMQSMTQQAWGKGRRQDCGQDKAKPMQQPLGHIDMNLKVLGSENVFRLLEPNADGSQKLNQAVAVDMGKPICLAIFLVGPSSCEIALIGTADNNRAAKHQLQEIRQRIPPNRRYPWDFEEYNVQISGEETEPWTCSRESELGLVMAGAFLDCLLHGFQSLNEREEAYDTRKISHNCLRHFLPRLQLTLEVVEGEGEKEEEGEKRSDGNSGHQDDHDDEEEEEEEEEDDSDEEDDDKNESANDGDGDSITKEEKEQVEKFDFDKIIDNMSMIDMEDNDDVENRIKGALEPHERRCMELSREIEEKIISALPTNEKVVDDMENDADIKRCVETYRQHVRTLIKSLAQFMLAAVSRDELPPMMRGWFVYIVANATEECRERLLNLLTHPSIQLLAMQYLLGQPVWWPGMFDSVDHRINLEKFKDIDDAVTAYIAVGHLSGAIHYLYNGSGTSTNPSTPLIGEAARMASHHKVLVLSPEEMARRRREIKTSLDKSILMAHTVLARSKERFFLPSQRYPVDMRDPTDPVPGSCAALALYAENLNAMLFSSCADNHVPRSASAEPFIRISRLFINKLRGDLPASPWNGANVVLPITQVPRAMWKLVKTNIRVEISSALNEKLRQYFAEDGKATLRRSVCLAMLDSEDLPLADPYIKALRLFYADILTEHGLKYRTYHEDKNLRLTILWVAIIRETESCCLVTPPDDDDDDDDDDAFELWDRDYEPLRTRLFALKKARARQPRSASSKAKAKEAARRVPPNTGTCSQCGAVSNNLSEHKKNCRGRCQRPHVGPCISDPHGPTCLSCKAQGHRACKYPSKPKKEHTVLCQQCKRYILQDSMRHHKCGGRCKPCRDAGEACVPTTGTSTKCQRCKITPGNLQCDGFSHQHLIDQGAKEKCKKCHGFYHNVKTHEITCSGRCERCVDLQKACGKKAKAGCSTCKADNVKCPRNYSDPVKKKKGECPRCKVDGVILQNHVKYCPGRCSGCVEAKEPCVCIQGDTSGRCVRCREKNIVVCGEKSHAHLIEKMICPDCCNLVTKRTYPQHQKSCSGQCTNCRKGSLVSAHPQQYPARLAMGARRARMANRRCAMGNGRCR